MKYKIRINPMAISDVQEIKEYIAQYNSEIALRIGNNLYSAIEKLADFPEVGASLSIKINIKTDYRYLVSGDNLIFYKIEGEYVSVYRILNGVRDYLSILFEDKPFKKTNK
ncbi:type II toxin-antitoxin system RelE/ParE family toxin [Desulfotomaculum defluvii]